MDDDEEEESNNSVGAAATAWRYFFVKVCLSSILEKRNGGGDDAARKTIEELVGSVSRMATKASLLCRIQDRDRIMSFGVPVLNSRSGQDYYLRTKPAAHAIQFTVEKQKLQKAATLINDAHNPI